jgi:hypothetical protein
MTALNEFDSDTHRRVCANLSVPRSALELARFLDRHDPHIDVAARDGEQVEGFLLDLEADGLVKRIKGLQDAKAAVKAMRQDSDVPTLPRAKASAYVERADRDDLFPVFDGREHWVFTKAALDRFNGPIRDEKPPKTGADLRAAEEANRALADRDARLAREGLLEEAKRLRARAAELKKEADR